MSQLHQLQNDFQEYLLSGKSAIQSHIVSTEKLAGEKRLEIYSYAYIARLHEAMSTTYPVLHTYLGSEEFEKLCHAYIHKHHSKYRSIRWYGDQLHHFLCEYPEYSEFSYLSELAILEWTMSLVFDAADSHILKIEEMTCIAPQSWESMRLLPHPSLHRVNFLWNTVSIWNAISEENEMVEPIESAYKSRWILWRKDLTNQMASLSEAEAWAMDAMLKGQTFGEMCEGLCRWMTEEEAGLQAASLLKGWIQASLITGIA